MGCGASSAVDVAVDDEENPGRLQISSHRKSFFRGSIISSIISKDQNEEEASDTDSVDSAIAVSGSEQNDTNEPVEKRQYICGTDVCVEFVIEVLCQRFRKEIDPASSWIAERLNNRTATEAAGVSAVVRVTFGWEDAGIPSSCVLKIPVAREAREGDKGKVLYSLFKRECSAYEWVHNFRKIVAPEIYHIKKHHNESGGAMILMEDLAEKGNNCNARDGLSVEVVRDLLKRLALIHAQSRRENSWSTVVVDLPSSHFTAIANRYTDAREFFERHEVERSRMEAIRKYFALEYLQQTITESADELKVQKVLVHGQPYAPNMFEKDGVVTGLLNWSSCHAGCFGEDIAKAICWNLPVKERLEHTTNLLESYHIHFVRYAGIECGVTFDLVRRAFDRFVPLAMVLFLNKVMNAEEDHENEPLFERARTLIQNVYSNDKIMAEAGFASHKASLVSMPSDGPQRLALAPNWDANTTGNQSRRGSKDQSRRGSKDQRT